MADGTGSSFLFIGTKKYFSTPCNPLFYLRTCQDLMHYMALRTVNNIDMDGHYYYEVWLELRVNAWSIDILS